MTPLAKLLIQRIKATGPLTLAEYMTDCLLHPEHGYYSTRDPFGAGGDFTTAPEISQMFGEMIGLCMAQAWMDQGKPDFVLAEIGPGRGTLMADILRVGKSVPGFVEAARVHLIEASLALRARQKETLSGHNVTWHDHIAELPGAPLFLIANEFFDALPIRQFTRDGAKWREHLINVVDGSLRLGLGDAVPMPILNARLSDTKDDDIIELCPAAGPIMTEISTRIAQHGGAALIVDYGDWRSLGDTFQALEAHETVDPFVRPGFADLTAHVDFEALALAATTTKTSALTPQGVFLERLGITERAQALAQKLTDTQLQNHIAAHRRLTHPEEMGSLFKVLGLTPKGAAALPGLDL